VAEETMKYAAAESNCIYRCSDTVAVSEQIDEDNSEAQHGVDVELSRKVGLACRKVGIEFDAQSRLPIATLPVIPKESITIGRLLGNGGFNEVISVTLKGKKDSLGREKVVAMKRLLPSILQKQDDFYGGALDLILEARLLNALQHPNIIKLYGVSCEDDKLQSCYLNGNRYCLFLEPFYVTLRERLDEWRKTHSKKLDLEKRIDQVVIPLAGAMEYLHSCNIIFRDLKPDNMGFDRHGTLKLFDFGLARETNPLCPMSSFTGSIRYMAPEVTKSEPYSLSADVYSFGVVVFECCTLVKKKPRCFPFRFPVPRSMKKLIKTCWDKNPSNRPTFSEIHASLMGDLENFDDPLHSMGSQHESVWTIDSQL
jgi:serine/threonine protein kinase